MLTFTYFGEGEDAKDGSKKERKKERKLEKDGG
jgi:hypothetical protein